MEECIVTSAWQIIKTNRPKFINLIVELPKTNFSLEDIDRIIQERRESGIEPEMIILHPEQQYHLSSALSAQQRFANVVLYGNEMRATYRGFPLMQTYQDNLGICYKCDFPAQEIVISGNKLVATCSNHYEEAKMLKRLEECNA